MQSTWRLPDAPAGARRRRAPSRRRSRRRPRRRPPSASPRPRWRCSSARASRARARRPRRSRAAARRHAGIRADQELDGIAPGGTEARRAARRCGSGAAVARPRTWRPAIASSGELGAAPPSLERPRRPARVWRSKIGRQLRRARSTCLGQLASRPRGGLAGVREPVALGAAALGVLQHRCDRAAVLSLQARERVEPLVDGREPAPGRLPARSGRRAARRARSCTS